MAWWKSCANHICNIHDLEGDGIGKCKHPDEEVRHNEQGEELVVEWIVPGSLTFELAFALFVMIMHFPPRFARKQAHRSANKCYLDTCLERG
jgi:hypothetical protein